MPDAQSTQFGDLAADDTGNRVDRPLILLHGLGFSRRLWAPAIRELEAIDPGRRAISFDLPGHGGSPALDRYDMRDLVAVVHDAVQAAGIAPPLMVGHSFGGALATAYATEHPVQGVVNVDQPLLVEGFAERLRQLEPVLRGPDYAQVWESMLAGMHTELLPTRAQDMIRAEPVPGREILLGYWNDLLVTPVPELTQRMTGNLAVLRAGGIPYQYVTGDEPPPAYVDWLTSLLPDVKITVFPGTGHFPQLARPAEIARLLTVPARLAQVVRRGSSGRCPRRALPAAVAAPSQLR
jgi:pimeloyl-ACP methyl ester carboxylesterase